MYIYTYTYINYIHIYTILYDYLKWHCIVIIKIILVLTYAKNFKIYLTDLYEYISNKTFPD